MGPVKPFMCPIALAPSGSVTYFPLKLLRALCTVLAMLLEFTKMNGAGNDFLLIDNREERIVLSPAQVVRLCHRQRGVGADGVFLLKRSRSGNAEWAWDFFNSDGSTAEMCGNGARCFARFIQKVAGSNGMTSFETGAGVIRAEFSGEHVAVDLTEPKELRLNTPLVLDGREHSVHFINTGVPHAVVFTENLGQLDVQRLGGAVRWHPHFAPRGTNANFVQRIEANKIQVRTFERGVEGETLACGTGVAASALVAARLHQLTSPVEVQVQGGDRLEVSFESAGELFKNVRLSGPAEFVFEGRIEI